MTFKELQESRGSLLKQADSIIRQTIAEKRDANSAESEKLGGIKSELLRVEQEIARAQTEMRTLSVEQNGIHGVGSMALEGYSLTRAIRSASAGRLDGIELEVSRELESRSGTAPAGFLVPSALLAERRAMSVTGNSGAFGNSFVATEKRGFIDALRPLLAVGKAGALILDGLSSNVDIPRQAAASTASWQTEVADLLESSPAIEQMELRPRRCGSYTVFSKMLLAQASLDVEQMVRMDLLQACAVALDAAAISGAGTPSPTGILSTVGVGDVAGGTNGIAPNWSHIVALIAKLEGQNALGGSTAFLINGVTAAKLRATPKVSGTDSRMILEGNDLLGHPVFVTNQVPSNLTKGTSTGVCSAILFGDFSQIVLGSFGQGLDLVVDPLSRAVQGQSRVIVNSYVDVGVRRAASFAAMKDALTV